MKANGEAINILALDAGNSAIRVGWVRQGRLENVERVPRNDWPGCEATLRKSWEEIRHCPRPGVVMASVCPPLTRKARDFIKDQLAASCLMIPKDVPLPLKLKIANSDTVGVDRILAAAAAFDRTKEAVAVADFGTAITIDCVNDDGEFLGGSILPGLTLSAQALHEKTAALPLITPGRPDGVFGTDTETAIRGGIFYAALGALREIVERYATHLGHWPSLVLTGGDAKLIAPACDFADGIEENLTLEGILLAWRRHVSQRKK